MLKGKITKLYPWKNGKGFFVGIDDVDYMFFGKPGVRINDIVQYETGESMKDGKPTVTKIVPDQVEEFVTGDKVVDIPKDWAIRRGGYSHDSAMIVAACISLVERGTPIDREAVVRDMIYFTDKLVEASEEREKKMKKG